MPISRTTSSGFGLEQLRHQRDDIGLRDRLAVADRQRPVLVGIGTFIVRHELVPFDGVHRFEHILTELHIVCPARIAAQLVDERGALLREVVLRGRGHGQQAGKEQDAALPRLRHAPVRPAP